MNRYKVTKVLGDGTYGSVLRAQNVSTGESVAIKKMKQKHYSWEECMKLREITSLRKLIHPNIVKLKEVIRENDELHLVFDFMEGNLYESMKGRTRPFTEAKVRNIMFQTMQALHHVHKHGYFHRDMKPENLLVSGDVVKLADFGLAREIRARPPFTDYVSTRWYRAPEVLLRSQSYNSPLDIWACGGIMAEVYTLRPLFPGSSESDQLFKICSVLGTPNQAQWPEGIKLAAQLGFKWPTFSPTKLETLVPMASEAGINIMLAMMQWDPNRRLSTAKILQHPFFEASTMPDLRPENAQDANRLPQLSSASDVRRPVQDYRPPQPMQQSSGGFFQKSSADDFGPVNSDKGGWAPPKGSISSFGGVRDSPSTNSKVPPAASALPPLGADARSGRRSSGAHKSGGSGGKANIYQRMARYQPGMQQPGLPAVRPAMGGAPVSSMGAGVGLGMGMGAPVPSTQDSLPQVGGPKPIGYFGGHTARMFS